MKLLEVANLLTCLRLWPTPLPKAVLDRLERIKQRDLDHEVRAEIVCWILGRMARYNPKGTPRIDSKHTDPLEHLAHKVGWLPMDSAGSDWDIMVAWDRCGRELLSSASGCEVQPPYNEDEEALEGLRRIRSRMTYAWNQRHLHPLMRIQHMIDEVPYDHELRQRKKFENAQNRVYTHRHLLTRIDPEFNVFRRPTPRPTRVALLMEEWK